MATGGDGTTFSPFLTRPEILPTRSNRRIECRREVLLTALFGAARLTRCQVAMSNCKSRLTNSVVAWNIPICPGERVSFGGGCSACVTHNGIWNSRPLQWGPLAAHYASETFQFAGRSAPHISHTNQPSLTMFRSLHWGQSRNTTDMVNPPGCATGMRSRASAT